MKKINSERALELAYENLYNGKIKHIDKHLDNLLDAKKIISQERGQKSRENEAKNER